jgi:hypothetical protein
MAHMRVKQDAVHLEWRDRHWTAVFKRGNARTLSSVQERLEALVQTIGKDRIEEMLHTIRADYMERIP